MMMYIHMLAHVSLHCITVDCPLQGRDQGVATQDQMAILVACECQRQVTPPPTSDYRNRNFNVVVEQGKEYRSTLRTRGG